MEAPLTPLGLARRARQLHPMREAVVDGDLRFTYAQFGERCDRWSAALLKLGLERGDRVGTIACNTHQHLEQYYAVPQIGAVIVPMNFRLAPDDFVFLANHSGCKVLCVHSEYLDAVDGVRDRMPGVRHFVALEGHKPGWLEYERLIEASEPQFDRPYIGETDLLSVHYTSGITARPKGVMITHRNAAANCVGTLAHWPMTPADRFLWTLPAFDANGWSLAWVATAVGATHVCARKVEATAICWYVNRERITALCVAPTGLIAIANAPEEWRRNVRRGVRVLTAGAPPAPVTIERVENELGWHVTFSAVQGVDESVVDVPRHGATVSEIVASGNVPALSRAATGKIKKQVLRNGRAGIAHQ